MRPSKRAGSDLISSRRRPFFQFGVDVGPRRLGHHPATPPGEFVDTAVLPEHGAPVSRHSVKRRRGGEAAAGHAIGLPTGVFTTHSN